MSDEPLTNPAIERVQRFYDHTNALTDGPSAGPPITHDFVFQDHRSGGANYGRIDGEDFEAFFLSGWDVTPGRLRLSVGRVVAVLGDRLAAYVEVVEYCDVETIEVLVCICLDPGLRRLRRMVVFDVGDVDAAIAELDRLQAEIDA